MDWNKMEVLISGGTGSLGKTLTKYLLKHNKPKGIRILSRDELKQWQMKQEVESWKLGGNVSFIIGDIRDEKRLKIAADGANIIIHTAAMKQVPSCEDNPLEAIRTNVNGSQNLLRTALSCRSIEKVMGISSDKAVAPINLYGMTKAVMEKLFIQGNVYSRGEERLPKFSICRYGNVIGSRGSVIPLFKKQAEEKQMITITHKDMTRFWITLPTVAKFIIRRIEEMRGGEIYIPEMPSAKVIDIANMVAPNAAKEFIGIRPGEKLHECLIAKEESQRTRNIAGRYEIRQNVWSEKEFTYTSQNNTWWINDKKDLDLMLKEEV